jgi:hypothetical protein
MPDKAMDTEDIGRKSCSCRCRFGRIIPIALPILSGKRPDVGQPSTTQVFYHVREGRGGGPLDYDR